MSRLATVNLIAAFDVYLIVSFIVSIRLRYRHYKAILSLIFGFPNRWLKLLELAKQHRTVFLTWPTLLPIILTFTLLVVNSLAYNFVWPAARVTPIDLWNSWLSLLGVCLFGLAMLVLDFDAVFNVGKFDRPALERDLDQAEYWLRSWAAPAVRVLTFGFINPRLMVSNEVQKALTNACNDLNRMMWRWSLQIALRLAFGLSLWLTWAFGLSAALPG